jgi:hypothetical protein
MTRAKSVLSTVLLSVAATFGAAGTAQAAIYTGNWDPAYGGNFPDLGWSASATFDVPDACLALGDGTSLPVSGDCAGFSVLSAEVSFYNIHTNAFEGTFELTFDDNVIRGIYLTDGELTGVDSNFFDYFVPTSSIAGGGEYSFSLVLYGGNLAQLIYANPPALAPVCPFLTGANCGISQFPAVGTFTTAIPEPETYVLMLAGLGAVGFAARRRRR